MKFVKNMFHRHVHDIARKRLFEEGFCEVDYSKHLFRGKRLETKDPTETMEVFQRRQSEGDHFEINYSKDTSPKETIRKRLFRRMPFAVEYFEVDYSEKTIRKRLYSKATISE